MRTDHNELYNDQTYWAIYSQLMEYAINMFEWKNLPDTCDERYLELILYEFGYALFFQKDDLATYGNESLGSFGNGAFLTLQATIGGMFDVYLRPIYRRAYSANGFNQECDDFNSVIIYNNYLRQPSFMIIEFFANRLYNIQRTIDTNLNALKTPILIRGSKSQGMTLRNLYKKYEGNVPFIFADKDIDIDNIEVLKTDAPNYVSDLMDAYDRVWFQALSFLGINNANTNKKERLVSDEANSNNEQILISRDIMLNARRQACDQINELFYDQLDAPIWVDFRHPNSTTQQSEGEEDEGDGGVYDNDKELS